MPALRSSERATAAVPAPPPTDSLAELTDTLGQGWRADLAPAVTAIALFIAAQPSLEAARDRLAGLLPTLPTAHFEGRLTNALLQARLAGLLGVPIMDDERVQFADPETGRVQLKPLADAEAVRYLADKVPAREGKFAFDWRDVRRQEHVVNFVVAKAMKEDLLGDIHANLNQALQQGWSRQRFVQEMTPILQRQGWWGEVAVEDPKDGKLKLVQAGSPRRLELIYGTNMRMAHAAGRWERYQRIAQPGDMLRYVAVMDSRTRPEHAAWNGILLPIDHPFWKTHYPPCGWNCRCTTVLVPGSRIKREGLAQTTDDELAATGYGQTFPWADKRRGDVIEVPKGIDPGFGYNVGEARLEAFAPRRPIEPLTPTPRSPPAAPPAAVQPSHPKRIDAAVMTSDHVFPGVPKHLADDLPPPTRLDVPSGRPATPDAEWRQAVMEILSREMSSAGPGPGVFLDKVRTPLVIDERLFRKAHRHGHKVDPLVFARTIADPDEIWSELEPARDKGASRLKQRYVRRFTLADGSDMAGLSVFELQDGEWSGATLFAPNYDRSAEAQLRNLEAKGRVGERIYRRP